jgi:hypothetical protein
MISVGTYAVNLTATNGSSPNTAAQTFRIIATSPSLAGLQWRSILYFRYEFPDTANEDNRFKNQLPLHKTKAI